MTNPDLSQPQRGRLYTWPRNRAFGESNRWVVVPISTDARLAGNPLAVPLEATAQTGLDKPSHAMAWLPTSVEREQLAGPLGRISPAELKAVLGALNAALDLAMDKPWQPESINR